LPPIASIAEGANAERHLSPEGAAALQCSTPEPGLATSPDSAQPSPAASGKLRTFKDVGKAVVTSIKASQGFNTLRDMGGSNGVMISELKTVRKLGEGAFAVVEEAEYRPTNGSMNGEKTSGRRVAVKKLKPEVVRHEADLASFIAESALLRKLQNKRVVEYIGVGSTDTTSDEAKRKTMFLVQEFMDGGTLKKLVSRQMIDVSRHIYSVEDAFRWALHVAEGLEYLHAARPVVIHRDLKLENILLKGSDPHTAEAKIADFGLVALVRARDRTVPDKLEKISVGAISHRSPAKPGLATSLSRMMSTRKAPQTVQESWDHKFQMVQRSPSVAGGVLPPQDLSGRTGSYMYMSPEMYRQEAYTEKVDVFSYGVIIFEVFSRYQTVCAISIAGTDEEIEAYAQKVSLGYRPPLPLSWPEPLKALITDLWAQDPVQRPSMAQAKERLLQMQADHVPAQMQAASTQPTCACVIA
ncbi:putative serine/threonine-protein kinase, partial [Tetrabaena socialis]